MKAEITEFSYGFAFTENFIRSKSLLKNAPIFLNHRQEYKLGYDLAIDLNNFYWKPMFFQFKIPDIMTNRRAREISEHNIPIYPDFFRMKFHKDNHYKQQRALAKLGNMFSNSVFYATPRFHKYSDLSLHFRNGEVHNKSAFFSPVDIENAGVIDYYDRHSNHSIAYRENGSFGWLCSETAILDKHNIDEIMKVTDIDAEPNKQVATEKVDTLFNSLVEILDTHNFVTSRDIVDSEVERIKRVVENFDDRDYPHNLPKIQALSFISRNFFGSEMFFSCHPK